MQYGLDLKNRIVFDTFDNRKMFFKYLYLIRFDDKLDDYSLFLKIQKL